MAIRRSVFPLVGLFDVRLGVGTPARSAEDLDFFYRCFKRGLKLRYSPAPHVYHAHGRRTPADVEELADGYMTGRGAFYFKHALRGDGHVLKRLYWELRSPRSGHAMHRREPGFRRLLSGGFGYILGR
jgi:GT2 family glycosyltransferase